MSRSFVTPYLAWDGRRPDDLFEVARELVEDVTFPTIHRWRDHGGKVVGHFQVYFPEEIAHAGGLLPVKVRGAQVEPRQADARFGSYLCSIIKTSLESALSGHLALDLFVSHPICDAARNLAAVWARNFGYRSEILYLPQNPNSGYAATYLREEYARLKQVIEEIAGREITDDDLRGSIQLFNRNRRLLRRLDRLRCVRPWLLAVDEAYVLAAIGGLMPREDHNGILSAALPLIARREGRPQGRMRVVFEGGFCEQPPIDLLHAIAECCYVVADDLMVGLRWIRDDVEIPGDPLLNLARAYLDQSTYSSVQHDARKPKERMLLRRMRSTRAQAAIITAAKMCEPGLDEQVAYIRALDAEKLPYFVSEFEERMRSFDQLQMQLETFVENVLFA
ncbi:MAG: 2-hydroxyacyl-CoA dehydratase [Acidobacteria bacterium]|nr:2-hydroxyacyl-CoA dehydratase [Acidobacteriota bacterium]